MAGFRDPKDYGIRTLDAIACVNKGGCRGGGRRIQREKESEAAMAIYEMRTHTPVSYTHLDVYKRQGLSFGFECSIEQKQVTRQFGLKSAILCMQCPEM